MSIIGLSHAFLTSRRENGCLIFFPATSLEVFSDSHLCDAPMMDIRRVGAGIVMHLIKKYERPPLSTPQEGHVCVRLSRCGKVGALVTLNPNLVAALGIRLLNACFTLSKQPDGILIKTLTPMTSDAWDKENKRFRQPFAIVADPTKWRREVKLVWSSDGGPRNPAPVV
jgi:hypothetical protein